MDESILTAQEIEDQKEAAQAREPKMVNVETASHILGVSPSHLYKVIKTDKSFPVVRLGGRLLVAVGLLDNWILGKVEQRQ